MTLDFFQGHGPNKDRVARVCVDLPTSSGRERTTGFATGYRISRRLILTVAHVLEKTADLNEAPEVPEPEIDLGGDGNWRPTRCVWHDGRLDVALLQLVETPEQDVVPVRLGRVNRSGETVAGEAFGHPVAAAHGDERPRVLTHCSVRTGDTDLRVDLDMAPTPMQPGSSPWQGMSGAPVFTKGLLSAIFKTHRTPLGQSTHEISALADIDDEEWRDLLIGEGVDPRPVLAFPDGWDRTRGSLRPHLDYMDEVALRGPVAGKSLGYVEPGEHPASPGRLLELLATLAGSSRAPYGVVVTGAGGMGKTRLCLETAVLAHEEGWLVVHLTKEAPLRDVWDSVRGLDDRVLLVADDISWLSDPPDVHRLIAREAEQLDVAWGMLTSARTPRIRDLDAQPLTPTLTFKRVSVRSDEEYHQAINHEIVGKIARSAIRQKGTDYVELCCFGPPHLSLLRAEYCDYLVRQGRDLDAVPGLRDPETVLWVRQLLEGAGLPAPVLGNVPDARTTAVARIAAAAPCGKQQARNYFQRGHADDVADQADAIVRWLTDIGILREDGSALSPGHEVYADYLLSHGLFQPGWKEIHPRTLEQVLEAAMGSGRVLARVATSVDRLRESVEEEPGNQLAAGVGQWADGHHERLRELVLDDPKGEGQTLRALLPLRTWRPAISGIAEEWLRRNHGRRRAGDALLAARYHLASKVSEPYVMRWIDENVTNPAAGWHLRHFLAIEDLDPSPAEIGRAVAYKRLSLDPLGFRATHEYQALLSSNSATKKGLPFRDQRVGQVIEWAKAWLEEHGDKREAGYVMCPLVQRPELPGPDCPRIAEALLAMARVAPASASFPYEAVLIVRRKRRRDLPDPLRRQVITDSLKWLESAENYGLTQEAAYVIKELVTDPDDLGGRNSLRRAVEAAWKWLGCSSARYKELGLVLPPVLKNVRRGASRGAAFTPDEQAELLGLTRRYLDRVTQWNQAASNVLGALLDSGLADDDPEALGTYASLALERMRDGSPEIVRALLPKVLNKKSLDAGTALRAREAAVALLERRPLDRHTGYTLTSLLGRRDLTPDDYEKARRDALRWLEVNPEPAAVPGLLWVLLTAAHASADDRGEIADRVVEMLSPSMLDGRKNKGEDLRERLLRWRAEMPHQWNRFAIRACALLADAGQPAWGWRVLRDLLKGSDTLDPDVLQRVQLGTADWSRACPGMGGAGCGLLASALSSGPLSSPARTRLTEEALARLNPGWERRNEPGRLLTELLRYGDLNDDHLDDALEFALGWLELRPGRTTAIDPLMAQITHNLDRRISSDRRAQLAQRALAWLGEWPEQHLDSGDELREILYRHRRRLHERYVGP